MTVETTHNVVYRPGNDVTTSFPFDYPVQYEDTLVVYRVDANGVASAALTLGVDYTVTLDPVTQEGSIEYPVTGDPLATGEKLIIARIIEPLQEVDLINQGAFFPEIHEGEFDKLTMLIQQMLEELDRALKSPLENLDVYDFEGKRGINAADPIDAQDVVTKVFVEQSLSSVRDSLLGVDPLYWHGTGTVGQTDLPVPGAPLSIETSYFVAIDGDLLCPGEAFTVDLANELIVLNTALSGGEHWTVINYGYAKAFYDIVTTATTIDADGRRIINLADGVASTDAASVGQVSAAIAAIASASTSVKGIVKFATLSEAKTSNNAVALTPKSLIDAMNRSVKVDNVNGTSVGGLDGLTYNTFYNAVLSIPNGGTGVITLLTDESISDIVIQNKNITIKGDIQSRKLTFPDGRSTTGMFMSNGYVKFQEITIEWGSTDGTPNANARVAFFLTNNSHILFGTGYGGSTTCIINAIGSGSDSLISVGANFCSIYATDAVFTGNNVSNDLVYSAARSDWQYCSTGCTYTTIATPVEGFVHIP